MIEPAPSSTYSLRALLDNRPLLLALVAVFIGLCLLTVFATLLLSGSGEGLGQDGEPTPFSSPVLGATDDVIIAGISGSTPISLSLNAPTSLQVGTQRFGVRAEPLQSSGVWDPDVSEGETALWVYGSLINYIIGLPDGDENRQLLEGLSSEDQIILTLRDGAQHRFAVTNREYIEANRVDVFAQNTPGLTLLLLRAPGDERLIVQGEYVVDTSPGGEETAGGLVELGETAQLGNLRITATEAATLFDRPQAPSGFIFFVIDFQVENVGAGRVDLTQLRFDLSDEIGNRYASSAEAATYGAYSPPAGTLGPGETRQASVGYQIPAGLTAPTLSWTVGRQGGTEQIEVTMPFAQSSEAAAENAVVTLDAGEVSTDGTSLVLTGQVSNNGSQRLVVNENNVSLRSDGTIHLMLSTNPAFPWVVEPGQSLSFAVTFQRPGVAEATFTILNHPFVIGGLR